TPNLALILDEASSLVGTCIAARLVRIPSSVAGEQRGPVRLGRGLMMW
ncbi:hypothetical protein TorRG33x02_339310, partial [Trema orientale]